MDEVKQIAEKYFHPFLNRAYLSEVKAINSYIRLNKHMATYIKATLLQKTAFNLVYYRY